MMSPIHAARADFYERAGPDPDFLAYVRQNAIDINAIGRFAGGCAVMTITDCGNRRFDFADQGFRAFVCEAFGADGETTVDLVAWPLHRPDYVLSMFGTCGLLGLWSALGSEPYVFGKPLTMHRTPLAWLRANCVGAAIVTPHVAARQFLDIPGRIAAQDQHHGRQLIALAQSLFDPAKFLVTSPRRAAA